MKLVRGIFALGTVALGMAASLSFAVEAPWLVRTRLITVAPDASGTAGLTEVDVNSDYTVEVDFTRFLTDHLALELIVATASQEVTLAGASLGSALHLPPTLTLQYHCLPEAKFRPYFGGGLNYTIFYDLTGDLAAFDMDDSFGWAVQLGADWSVTDRTSLNFDVKRIAIESDVSAGGTDVGTVEIDPWVVGVGMGWRF